MIDNEPLNRAVAGFTNRTSSNISIHLEPQGHHFTIHPGKKVIVVAYDSPEGLLEVDIETERISVWAWYGSTIDIYQDGTKMMTDQGYIPYED